jgi:hypothetical protein
MNDVQQFFNGGAWFAISLIIYLAMIAFGLIGFANLGYKQYRLVQPRRHRILLVAFLTLAFTPSILPAWLFILPAPATLGLILVFHDLFISNLPFSDQRGIILLYVYPLLFGFALFYTALFLRDWCRTRRAKRDQVA